MKKFLILFLAVATLCSCVDNNNNSDNNNKNGVTFAPKEQKETIVTKGPAVQKDPNDPIAFEGCVKLMIILPEGLPSGSAALLRTRMMHMASINNMGAIDGSPTFVFVPTIEVLNHDITATVPAKHKVKYIISIYVANLATGDVYGTIDDEIIGIGDSGELALTNAISGIDPNADKYQQMLKTAQDRIITYYNTEAEALAKVNRFEEALTILNSVPMVCSCYEKAAEAKHEIMDKYFVNNSGVLVAKMKAALASPRDNEEGFSKEFLALYTMLPPNCKARAEADKLYADYRESLDKAAVQVMEKKEREWQRQIQMEDAQFAAEREDKKYEFEKYKIKIESETAVAGQTALLEKYKKDAAYEKLGFFRKLFYNGEE